VRVLINAVSARIGGGITVLRHLLGNLPLEDGGSNSYHVFVRREVWEMLKPNSPRVIPIFYKGPKENAAFRLFSEQVHLPTRAFTGRYDVLFSTANLGVWASPIPQVLMFQNSAPFERSVVNCYPLEQRGRLKALRRLSQISAVRVSSFIYLSQYSANLIDPIVNEKRRPYSVVPLGNDPHFYRREQHLARTFCESRGIRRPFLLCVSQLYRYKNLVELVEGYAGAGAAASYDLVIVGAACDPGYKEDIEAAAKRCGVGKSVWLLGHVERGDLPMFYSAAHLFVFPSRCESFPNILIEAFACGVVAALSDRGPMKEIAGAAAIYFDPTSSASVAKALVQGLSLNAEERRSLSAAATRIAQTFSWKHTSKLILESLAQSGDGAITTADKT